MKILKYLSHVSRRNYSKDVINKKWKSVVGLEVHAQISSSSKLFSGASTEFSSPVNCNVSLFDLSTPGTLPVLNKRCVEAGVLTALALNCKVNALSMFDRKHYFYADLPAGYQITQQRAPLANDGYLQFQVYNPDAHKTSYEIKVHLKQLQLEQDSGKSLHDDDRSLLDLNRVGIPLMELVFNPDLKDGEEAAALIKELIIILQRLGSCSCKMEEGALRVDANVSVHQPGQPLGVRTEVKNIGSIRGVYAAITYEIKRQIKLLEAGQAIVNETRSWDAISKTTLPMRDKEEKQDYRYMPEPNLPPLYLAVDSIEYGCLNVNKLKKSLPELPEETRRNLINDLGLTTEQAVILVNENKLLHLFQEACVRNTNTKLLANLIINDFLTLVNKQKLKLEEINFQGKCFQEIADMLQQGIINRNTAKLVLKEILQGCTDKPKQIVKQHNWTQITNDDEIRELCEMVIKENPKIVQLYKNDCMMNCIQCQIILDNEGSFVKQMIIGTVEINTEDEVLIQHALIEVFGIATCQFTLGKILINFPRIFSKGAKMTAEEKFYFSRHTLIGGDDLIYPHKGHHVYPFKCGLPISLPATWNGTHGNIKYTGRIIVKGNNDMVHVHLQEIIILPRKDLMREEYLLCEARQDIKRTFSFAAINLGTVKVSLWLPICGVAAGQSLPVLCTIVNDSRVQFGGIIFVLTKKEIYRSTKPIKTSKVVRKDVCRIPRMVDILSGRYEYYCVLETDEDTIPTNQYWRCRCCHVIYEVWVSVQGAVPRYSAYGYPNVDTPGIPVIIGTESLKEWNSDTITADVLSEIFTAREPVIMEPSPPDDEVEELLNTVEEELDSQTVLNLTRQVQEAENAIFRLECNKKGDSISGKYPLFKLHII